MENELTRGPVMQTMLRFAIPMILGDLLQQCYNIADTLIVGRFLGEEALAAVRDGADCLGVGAMFSTSTKADADVLPRETLRAICDAVDIPVVAIGGITKHNIAQLAGSGVDGVALVSAIFSAPDIESECRLLRRLSEEMVNA